MGYGEQIVSADLIAEPQRTVLGMRDKLKFGSPRRRCQSKALSVELWHAAVYADRFFSGVLAG
jgi:hypothetical protein